MSEFKKVIRGGDGSLIVVSIEDTLDPSRVALTFAGALFALISSSLGRMRRFVVHVSVAGDDRRRSYKRGFHSEEKARLAAQDVASRAEASGEAAVESWAKSS